MLAIMNIKTPKSCEECYFLGFEECCLLDPTLDCYGYDHERREDCPLIVIKDQENGPVAIHPIIHSNWHSGDCKGAFCSNCEKYTPFIEGYYDYCPRCGAKMDKGEKDGNDKRRTH